MGKRVGVSETAPSDDLVLRCQDPEIEAALLGSMMLEPDACDVALAIVTEDAFYRIDNRKVFRLLKVLRSMEYRPDILMIRNYLEAEGSLEEIGGVDFLVQLCESVPSAANVEYYARMVAELHSRRRSYLACHNAAEEFITQRGRDELLQTSDVLSKKIGEYTSESSGSKVQSMLGVNQPPTEIHAKIEPPVATLSRFGIWKDEYTIIGARPSRGKTSFLVQLAWSAALAGEKVLLFSQETSQTMIAMRLVTSLTGVETWKIRLKKMGDGEIEAVKRAYRKVGGVRNLWVVQKCKTLREMRANHDAIVRREGEMNLVLVDYLQICDGEPTRENRFERVSRIASEFATWRHPKTAVVVASQLSRLSEKENRLPRLDDLRESGTIEQDADSVWFIHSDTKGEDAVPRRASIIVAKQRNGPTGKVDLNFWQPRYLFGDGVNEPPILYHPEDLYNETG